MTLGDRARRAGGGLKRAIRRLSLLGEARSARRHADGLAQRTDVARREVGPIEPPGYEVTVFGSTHRLVGGADWHTDSWSGRTWPLGYHRAIEPARVVGGSDVKWPWELSRFHFVAPWAVAWTERGDEASADAVMRTIADWMQGNPVGHGINWTCAMEAGIRSVNWLFARALLTDFPGWTEPWDAAIVEWLLEHASFIEANLEDWGAHSQNHLVADLTGAFCVWAEVGGASCTDRVEWARERLEAAMSAQVYADGVSFENSTTYHLLVAELFATALACGQRKGVEFSEAYRERLRGMVSHAVALSDRGGMVPQIGDGDDGRVLVVGEGDSAGPRDARWLAALGRELLDETGFGAATVEHARDAAYAVHWSKPTQPPATEGGSAPSGALTVFEQGGLFVLTGGPTRLVAVFAPTGVNGTGPHRHNDALSVVLDVDGQPVLVDSGTYCYQHDPQARREMRSARAHCTAMVDGLEHNDIGPLFAIERDRMNVQVGEWGTDASSAWVRGRMSSFDSVGVNWSRSVSVDSATGEVRVVDEFSGSLWPHRIELFWRHAAGAALECVSAEGPLLRWEADGHVFACDVSGSQTSARLVPEDGWYSERYRHRVRAQGFVVVVDAGSATTLTTTVMPKAASGKSE